MKYVISIFCLVLCVSLSTGTAAAPAPAEAQLLADVKSVRPGDTFHVGVLFRMQPGWHIYWLNPGDAGMATEIRFSAPEGVEVSPAAFPLPTLFLQPGNIIGYGYEQMVLLPAEVKVSQSLRPGTELTIDADASWLCCREVCIPGQAKLQVKVQIAEQAAPDNQELFATWVGRLPVPVERAQGVQIKNLRSGVPQATPTEYELTLQVEPSARSGEFFPLTPGSMEVSDVRVEADGGLVTVRFSARVLAGQKVSEQSLSGVVAWVDQQNNRRGVRVDFPFTQTR